MQKRLAAMQRQQLSRRFWEKDATLWKKNAAAVIAIRNRLGWLTAIEPMQAECPAITGFADQVRAAWFTHALLLGMGGSSLCAEVFRQSFGVRRGFLDLAVLDSTDPAAVVRAAHRAPLEKTLFLVSTKSGTTTETLCFFRYFYDRLRQLKGERAGENFVAITDPGSPLVALADQHRFRRVFLNPPDIGGRFSVLSYFGLVPAALLRVDIRELLARASRFLPNSTFDEATEKTEGTEGTESNPAVQLGTILGELALCGRDKLTIFLSAPIASFGLWVEQLIAESTGKRGQGLFPVHGEPLGNPVVYGQDRVFVHLRMGGCKDAEIVRTLRNLVEVEVDLNPARSDWLFTTVGLPDAAVKESRDRVRCALRVATSASYGPRYLHSTGQFHKGGPPKGVLLEITADPRRDHPIPGMSYSFGQLELAQAQGDLEALQARQRPVLRLHPGKNADDGLAQFAHRLEKQVRKTSPGDSEKRRAQGVRSKAHRA
ncbi:MAG: hypothetical protein HY649_05785 [Acidobacteria bacterium]|nr:hypothetical protein [Acidobacteriota bacterium]